MFFGILRTANEPFSFIKQIKFSIKPSIKFSSTNEGFAFLTNRKIQFPWIVLSSLKGVLKALIQN